jgi:hypothetical protein
VHTFAKGLLVAIAVCLAGCSQSDTGQEKTSDVDGIRGKLAALYWPKNAPAYVPPFPGAKFVTSSSFNVEATSDEAAKTVTTIAFKTRDSVQAVFDLYTNACTQAGFRAPFGASIQDDAGATMVYGTSVFVGVQLAYYVKSDSLQETVEIKATKTRTADTLVQITYVTLKKAAP